MKLTLALYLSLLIIFNTPLDVYNQQIEQIEAKEVSDYAKTIEMDELDEFFIRNEGLKNKRITCIGDSITYGNGGIDDDNGGKISYCNYLSTYLNSEVINLGMGGAPIGDYWDDTSLILRWQDIPKDSDVIVIFAGLNDYFIGEYGDIELKENKTYCGDTYRLFKIIKDNFPNSKIFIVLTYQNETEHWTDFENNNLSLYLDTQKTYATEFGFEVIDLYSSSFLNSNDGDIKNNLIPDGVHPNDEGNKILARKIATEISIKY